MTVAALSYSIYFLQPGRIFNRRLKGEVDLNTCELHDRFETTFGRTGVVGGQHPVIPAGVALPELSEKRPAGPF